MADQFIPDDAVSIPQNDEPQITPMTDEDVELQMPQDELDATSSRVDPIMNEFGDNPQEDMGMSPADMKQELDKIDSERPDDGGTEEGDTIAADDARENAEDNDENAGNGGM